MRLIHKFEQFDVAVTLEQHSNGKFRVIYGKEVRDNLSYGAAARELGECLLHSMSCASLLDSTDDDED